MKVLVTGANGYIGSKIVKKLLDDGIDVIATDLRDDHIDKRATIIITDIFSDKNFFDIFNRPDVCIHFAWRDGFVHNSPNHILDLSYHFSFLKSLVDSGLKQLAVMGSMHEIGYYEGKVDENTICNPKTYYGIAKNSLRKSLEILCNGRTKFQWLRGYYIYGDDSFGNSIFCKIRMAVRDGKRTFPFTSGKNMFDFISIQELENQITLAITQDKVLGIINICSGKPISLGEKVEDYIRNNKLPIKLDYGKFPDRKFESPCIYGDNSKIDKIKKMKRKYY